MKRSKERWIKEAKALLISEAFLPFEKDLYSTADYWSESLYETYGKNGLTPEFAVNSELGYLD